MTWVIEIKADLVPNNMYYLDNYQDSLSCIDKAEQARKFETEKEAIDAANCLDLYFPTIAGSFKVAEV